MDSFLCSTMKVNSWNAWPSNGRFAGLWFLQDSIPYDSPDPAAHVRYWRVDIRVPTALAIPLCRQQAVHFPGGPLWTGLVQAHERGPTVRLRNNMMGPWFIRHIRSRGQISPGNSKWSPCKALSPGIDLSKTCHPGSARCSDRWSCILLGPRTGWRWLRCIGGSLNLRRWWINSNDEFFWCIRNNFCIFDSYLRFITKSACKLKRPLKVLSIRIPAKF